MNFTFLWGGRMDWALAHLVNVRSGTGFTTHGHNGVDVSLYAMGVSADAFVGHWSNDEIGRLLTRIMRCEEEQRTHTLRLQEMFVNGSLRLCDALQKPPIREWNESMPYPEGNLLFPQKCVEQWV